VGDVLSHEGFGELHVKSVTDLGDSAGTCAHSSSPGSRFWWQTLTVYLKPTNAQLKPEALAPQPKIGVRFYTQKLQEVRRFYAEVLDLSPTAESPSLLRYGPNIVFAEYRTHVAAGLFAENATAQSLVLEVPSLDV